MMHLVLLGDSIFDNAAYVADGPAVIDQVTRHLPEGWLATLLAIDGDTSVDVREQLERLPPDATHLVLSVGGNDALGCLARLETTTSSVRQGLTVLTQIKAEFERNYQGLLSKLMVLNKPLLVCTIYDQVPGLPAELGTALGLFNDAILREAVRRALPVLDLRMICTQADDYSEISPIEPSSKGGEKLASKLVAAVLEHDFSRPTCVIYR